MEIFVSHILLPRQSLYSPSSILSATKIHSFTHFSRRRCSWEPKPMSACCSTYASLDPGASIFGGWEELEFLEEVGESGVLHPFREFLFSVGIDDRKHSLPFLLGFCAAFAVSRVRFSTIALIPFSLLVFLGGFAMGAVQAGFAVKKLWKNGVSFNVFEEKLKHLEDLFSDVDGKLLYLRKGLERGIDADGLGMAINESYLQTIEHVKAAVGEAQTILTNYSSNDLLNDFDFGAKKPNQKYSRKRMDLGMSGIDFFQFLNGILLEPLIGSKTGKRKDEIKEKLGQQLNPVDEKSPFLVSDREFVAESEIEDYSTNPLRGFNLGNSDFKGSGMPSNNNKWKVEKEVTKNDDITNDAPILNNAKYKFETDKFGGDVLSFDEEINNRSSSLRFMTSRKNIIFDQKHRRRSFNSSFHDSNGSTTEKKTEDFVYVRKSESSSLLEHTPDINNRAHNHSRRTQSSGSSELNDNEMNGFGFSEASVASVNYSIPSNQGSIQAKGEGKLPYYSNKSTDEQFDENVKEAKNLLNRARECMMIRASEEEADIVLYKAAELLSSAVVMRPMSLIAVGQLGNIYLLHGELKLKVARELRTLLLRSDSLFDGKSDGLRFRKFDSVVTSREDIVSVLVSVCEECEDLLVEAGRKYRSALSIDKNDVRALYNWGIALCFRAQLIADIGPEAALDADKIYLAAIDKFNAMMSESNAFAPDALYRWGMVLKQRSHLRPKNSREKEMLLQQAKSLFEDVLSMESENKLVKDALVSCMAELNYNGQF